MSNQQNLSNNSSVEIPPSRRVYKFKDLPPESQQNLLRLQDTDGDFLKYRNSLTNNRAGSLLMLLVGFVLFIADLAMFYDENIVLDLKWIIVFSASLLIFALCFLYLIWGLFKTRRAPIKNGIYLTQAQVIETADGLIRYRDLKDLSEINIDKFQGGWRTSLEIKFADGDLYKYELFMIHYGMLPAKLIAKAEEWQEKIERWKSESLDATQRIDTAYFDSLDVIQKSATAITPAMKKIFPSLLPTRIMFVITIAIFVLDVILFLVIKIGGIGK